MPQTRHYKTERNSAPKSSMFGYNFPLALKFQFVFLGLIP